MQDLNGELPSLAKLFVSKSTPLIMGVLNITPDSFSDGGRWAGQEKAFQHAINMVEAGADIIDIGGESTRPGAGSVSAESEINRVVPLIENLRLQVQTPISIDTSKPEVMKAAVSAGANMINDVYALRLEGALQAASELAVPVCLMHMQGKPRHMQQAPAYDDVVHEVSKFLLERAAACQQAGIPSSNIVIDPGFGFGKTLQHNQHLFRAIPLMAAMGFPLLVGVSRKSMLGEISGREVDQRLSASLASAVLAAQSGASILRVHDVPETVDAIKVLKALGGCGAASAKLLKSNGFTEGNEAS